MSEIYPITCEKCGFHGFYYIGEGYCRHCGAQLPQPKWKASSTDNFSPCDTDKNEPLNLVKEAVRLLYKANYHDGKGTTWRAIQLLETITKETNDEP